MFNIAIILLCTILLFIAYRIKQDRMLHKLRKKLIELSFVQMPASELNYLISYKSNHIKGNWYSFVEAYFSKDELIFIQKNMFNSFEFVDYLPIAVARNASITKLILDSENIFIIDKFISIKNRIYITAHHPNSINQKLEINFTVQSEDQVTILSKMRDWIDS